MRNVVERRVSSKEAVVAYHHGLKTSGTSPARSLEVDQMVTKSATSA